MTAGPPTPGPFLVPADLSGSDEKNHGFLLESNWTSTIQRKVEHSEQLNDFPLGIGDFHLTWQLITNAAAGSGRWCLRMCRPKTEHCNQMSWLFIEGTRNFHTLYWHTLHYITLPYLTLHYTTLRYINYITFGYITLQCIKVQCITAIVSRLCPAALNLKRHFCWVNYMTSHRIILHCITYLDKCMDTKKTQ